jgi:nucleotide-binding universal stress UspA family protein
VVRALTYGRKTLVLLPFGAHRRAKEWPAGKVVRRRVEGRTMYERILVALDHSAVADRVIAAMKELAGGSTAKVWVLHLREREVVPRLGLVATESDSEAAATVDGAVKDLAEAGIDVSPEVRDTVFGYAAREIVEDAKLHDVNLIVMGSRGRGDLAGLVLGSTAHKVIHLADRPVLVVR